MDNSPDPRWQDALRHSRFLANLLTSRPALIPDLAAAWTAPLSPELLRAAMEPPAGDDDTLKSTVAPPAPAGHGAHRVRDLCGLAPLAEVVETMTQLADFTTNFALDYQHRQLAATYGEPLDKAGRPQRLLIIGMGKLGGRELNVSSDIDLIFVYPEDGETAGAEAASRTSISSPASASALIAALGDITGDGQVFRVDMRLRPNGDSGPLVCSLRHAGKLLHHPGPRMGALRLDQGARHERGRQPAAEWRDACRRSRRPFVFRKYLDFGAINAMRDLHAQIRREVARKDMADNVKLGPGGIREIEFIAQVFQLIRGGRDPALQIQPTLAGAAAAGRAPPAAGRKRGRTARRLRLPAPPRTSPAISRRRADAHAADNAGRPGSSSPRPWALPTGRRMLAVLDDHRDNGRRHFEEIFSDPEAGDASR